jgi:hypothetical protein
MGMFSGKRQRELEVKATRLLRAGDRRKRAVAERAPPAESPIVAASMVGHLRLADLGWAMKQLRRRRRHLPGDFKLNRAGRMGQELVNTSD